MLHLHRSERADALVDGLAGLLAEPLADPMAAEVVAVPSRGVERWITQRLSDRLGVGARGRDGVCANVEFPFPAALVLAATARATGVEPDDDPWRPDRAVWPLLQVVDARLDEPWMAPLAAHLRATSADGDALRRFSTVRHIADLFDRYSVHRPEMVRGWADGEIHVPVTAQWQARLWQALRAEIGTPSPSERLPRATAALADAPGLLDLPPRLSLFGLTRLPPSYLAVISAIAAGRDVHLFLLHPSGALWDAVRDGAAGDARGAAGDARAGAAGDARAGAAGDARAGAPALPRRRSADTTAGMVRNPVLASWGRDAREMQLVVTARGPFTDDYRPVSRRPNHLLGQLQHGIRANLAPPGRPPGDAPDQRDAVDPADRSVQIHSCHGRGRQVEVVRDAVMHLLADDDTLEPRDVIIMCPDIETFAPLIHAAFGAGDLTGDAAGSGRPDIQVRLADRAIRQTNPLLAVAAHLLELSTSRVTATDVLDLAGRDPVRRRFRFDDDELAQIQLWLAGTGVRWGLDGSHRARWDLAGVADNTWEAGVDRILLGATMAEDDQRLVGDTLPLDDVGSNDLDLAGRFAEFVARLGRAVRTLSAKHAVAGWADSMIICVDLLAVATPSDGWQRDQLARTLNEVVEGAGGRAVTLAPAEIRSLLGDRLRGQPTRANFRTGHLTVCTLVPMRSVPHRVVCLLGIDEDTFPRNSPHDGDDLMLADPCVGDRDGRSEDRQLLLDAVLAASDHLIITYAGRDVRTNQPRPPAVPVAELIDLAERTARVVDGDGREIGMRSWLVTEHPLQPFNARNFTPGRLGTAHPWSFDPVHLAGARALAGGSSEPVPFLPGPLPPRHDPVIELANLVRFVEHPVRAFLRERLGVFVGERDQEIDDRLPVELDNLQKWGLGDRLVKAILAGGAPQACEAAERARGLLPPGALADVVLNEVRDKVHGLVAATLRQTAGGGLATSLEVNVALTDGRALIGSVPNVWSGLILTTHYSRLAPKHRLASWVRYLALTASTPDVEVAACAIGQAERGNDIAIARVPALPGTGASRRDRALQALTRLVDLYDRGMRAPLPLYCKTSAAYAASRQADPRADAWEPARKEWEPRLFGGEQTEPEHQLIYAGPRAFEDIQAAAALEDECGDGWDVSEPSRFGRLAARLWSDLLQMEVRGGPDD